MKIYELKRSQYLNCSIEEAWAFFSSPKNLKEITPKSMGFQILSEDVREGMYAGQIIQYVVKPVLGIPLKWVTEITQVEHGSYFVDEQRYGPYSFWHHKHFFEKKDDGVLMTDLIHYGIPLGFIGRIANKLFVRNQLERIFEFRKQTVTDLF